MIRRVAFSLGIVICLSMTARSATAGELDAVRDSVRSAPDNNTGESKPSRKESSATHDDDEPGIFSQLFGPLFLQALISPWSVPLCLTGDEYLEPMVVVPEPYLAAPYAMRPDTPGEKLPTVFGRLQLDFATNFDGLDRVGGQLLLETPSRWGLDSSWSNWWETRGNNIDALQLGDANLVFRFAQSEDLQFRTGLGVNWMADSSGGNLGFNFTHGFDYYPRPPWVISSTFDFGTLGHAGLFHNQSTVGYLFGRCEVFTGFEYYHIGHGELSGWISGLRYRF